MGWGKGVGFGTPLSTGPDLFGPGRRVSSTEVRGGEGDGRGGGGRGNFFFSGKVLCSRVASAFTV